MQSTGHTYTHELSLTPMHVSASTYVTARVYSEGFYDQEYENTRSTLPRPAMRIFCSWLLVGPTVRVTCWPNRLARDCSHTWRASAARLVPTSSQRSWRFIPVGCVSIWSACTPPV